MKHHVTEETGLLLVTWWFQFRYLVEQVNMTQQLLTAWTLPLVRLLDFSLSYYGDIRGQQQMRLQ